MADKQRTAKVRITAEVVEDAGYPTTTIAETELSERVTLDDGDQPFGPVLPLIEQTAREAVTKTTAQVTAYETLSAARAQAKQPASPADPPF